MKNILGKEETAFTVQYDLCLPKRFELKFINEKGKEEQPVVIHRSSIGAIERTLAFLIEKYAGAFPVWLSPVQVQIIPISEKHFDYAKKLDQAGETMKQEANDASPGRAQKLSAQNQGSLLQALAQMQKNEAQLIILQAQNLGLKNRQEKLASEEFLEHSNEISNALRMTNNTTSLVRLK